MIDLKVYHDYHAMSDAAASKIIDCIKKKPTALLCFATGDTPKLTYRIIAENVKRDAVDFTKCFIIGLDEWLGIPPANPGSCHYFLHQYLFQPLSIDSSQVHLFDAMTTNEEEECKKMNNITEEQGPIDLMLVGVGMNGHIGFNEPGTGTDTRAHVSVLDETTKSVGKKYFQDETPISKGITLGLKQVMQAETLLILANGKKKAAVIKRTMESEITTSFPASLIRQHKNSTLIIDSEAASELQTYHNER